jgi:hypothetical protein
VYPELVSVDARHRSGDRQYLSWSLLAMLAPVLVCAEATTNVAQELPRGGTVPDLRRAPDGQIEAVPQRAAPPGGRRTAAPAGNAPKSEVPRDIRNGAVPAVSVVAPQSPQPVITVLPKTPRIRDTAPLGTVLAGYSVRMSDGSRFTGRVRFAAPHYDSNKVFALTGDTIIVNPNGPGLGPNKTTITRHITLETVP